MTDCFCVVIQKQFFPTPLREHIPLSLPAMAAVSSPEEARYFSIFYNTTSTGSNEFMTHQLKSRDIIALGFMTFALFVGAGNIIFPPMVGLQAGEHVWTAAIGFLITAVGLPVLTVVALAKVGGGVESLSTPIGKVAGILLAVVCYLAVGPLFATRVPRPSL
jgi:LIVCS family branched-chain amino acid:cation transporter